MLQLSALSGQGVPGFWQTVATMRDDRRASGATTERRRRQDEAWMWERIEAGLRHRFRNHPAVQHALPSITTDVREGRLAASVAARRLLDLQDRGDT